MNQLTDSHIFLIIGCVGFQMSNRVIKPVSLILLYGLISLNKPVFGLQACTDKVLQRLSKYVRVHSKWASPRENLSSGFPPKRVSNQSPQLQRLAKKLKFHL